MSKSHVVWHVAPQSDRDRKENLRLALPVRAHGIVPGNLYQPNGKREIERRRRQIDRGQIQVVGHQQP